MTVTFKYESRTDHYGTTLWCEEYTDKHSGFKKFWRWGVDNKTCGDLLSSKPNMNRLMKTYLADGEIEVETNTVDSIHKAFNGEGKRKIYTIQNNLSENLNHRPMRKVNENVGGWNLIKRRIEDINSKADIEEIIEHILGGFDVMYQFIIGDYDYELNIYEAWNGKTTIRVELINCNDFTDGYVYKEDVIAKSPNVVEEVYNLYKTAVRLATNSNIKENLKTQPMRKINEDRIVPDVEWNENDEWDDNFNVNYIFQLSRMVMFNVSYRRLAGNKQPYFATSAQVFCRNKRDITRGGQCQADVLKDFPAAYEFWKKWDKKHLHRLDYRTYQELLEDIKFLKEEYNWDYINSDSFPFSREVELSKQKPKRRIVRESVDVDDDYVYGFDRNRKEHIAIRRSTGLVGYGKNKEEALKNIPTKKTYANKVIKDNNGDWKIVDRNSNETIGKIYKDEKGWWTVYWFDIGRKRSYGSFSMAREVARDNF